MSPRTRREWRTFRRSSGLKHKRVYVAKFLRPDGTYARETLKDAEGHNIRDKSTADKIALQRWNDGVPGTADGLGPWLESWWSADGTYARDKRDQGEPLSAVYRANNFNNVKGHIRPALVRLKHDLLPVDRVTPELLRQVMRIVGDKGLSGRTVNTVRQTMAVPLRAYWEGKLHPERNPCTARLVPHFDEAAAERQVFSLAEARRFLAQDFGDPRLAAIQWQMAFTGMRLGECLGMQHGDLRSESLKVGRSTVTEYWIAVAHNWQEREAPARRVKGPKRKGGKPIPVEQAPQVPVPAAVAERLLKLERMSPYGGPFLYWGFAADRAYPKDKVERSYNAACEAIGIGAVERKRRGLGPHAWRHWYDTYMHVDPAVMQKLMRHRTAEMTAHYRHLTDEQRRGAAQAAAGLLGMVEPSRAPARTRHK